MTKIASDAMIIQLAMDMAGEGEVQERLERLNEFIGTINAKSKAAADSVEMERMSVEGKYNPDIQRDYEIEKAIQLTNKLNLSLEAQDAILAEIEEKHRRANQSLSQQYSPANTPGDDMVAAFRSNQDEIAKAEEESLAARKKAAKETARLEEEELTNKERLLRRYEEIREQRRRGEIDNDGAMLRARAAKREYDELEKADADRLDLIQKRTDAEEKAAADEKALFAARLEALNNSLEEEKRVQNANDNDAIVEANQRRARAAIDATTAADNAQNAARQRALSILYSLEDATERYARVTDELRAHLDAGDITNEQYAQGLANIERRQRSMAGGANNVAYAIGNTVTGLEDFVTVLSITGFGMEGFSAATRAASNNVGQAVRSLGTASAAIAAPLVSIGMVLAGAAIPQIYNYITGVEDAEKATRKFEESLKSAIRTARLLSDANALSMERDVTKRDIAKMDDPEAIMDRMKGTVDKIAALMNDMQGTKAELKSKAGSIFDSIISTESMKDFDTVANELPKYFGDKAADMEADWRNRMVGMRKQFIDDAVVLGAEGARTNLENNMKALQGDMQAAYEQLSGPDLLAFEAKTTIGGFNNVLNMFPDLLNDAAIIDEIQAVTEALNGLNKEDTLEYSKKRKELESYKLELEQLQDQRAKAIEAERALNDEQARIESITVQQQIDSELRSLEIQQRRASLLGEENEAERRLLDLALKREQMGRSGTIPDDVLDNLFNMELKARADQLEKLISEAENVTRQSTMLSVPKAYTEANKQAAEAASKDNGKKLQEMIDELKAIKDHLSGKSTLQVELV